MRVGLGCYKWYQSRSPDRCASKDAGPQGGWIVKSHICWRGERSGLYKAVDTSPIRRPFGVNGLGPDPENKTVRGARLPIKHALAQSGQYPDAGWSGLLQWRLPKLVKDSALVKDSGS